MPRARRVPATRKRRKKYLKRAKGFFGGRRKLYKTAKETVTRAMAFSTRDRKKKKRDYRRLWITRINAACRKNSISYSQFISGLKRAKVSLNRKALAEIAARDRSAFKLLVELSKILSQARHASARIITLARNHLSFLSGRPATHTAASHPLSKQTSRTIRAPYATG